MSGGLAIVALVSIGIYFTLQQWVALQSKVEVLSTTVTAYEMFTRNLILFRTVTGAVLLLAWPLAFRFGAKLLRVEAPSSTHNVGGMLLASGAYAATWLPPQFIVYALGAVALASLLIVAAAYRPGVARAPALWLIQGIILVVVEVIILIAIEGPRPLVESPEIVRFLSQSDLRKTTGAHPVHGALLPSDYAIEWTPTGSSWLDQKIGRVAFEITPARDTPPLVADFQSDGKTVLYKDITTVPFRFSQTISPGQRFHLVISWRDLDSKLAPLNGSVVIYSVLPPRVIFQSNPA